MCLDCKRYLNLEISGHRASSKNFPVYCNNWNFTTWGIWKKYPLQLYGNIDDLGILNNLSNKIKVTNKDLLKRDVYYKRQFKLGKI